MGLIKDIKKRERKKKDYKGKVNEAIGRLDQVREKADHITNVASQVVRYLNKSEFDLAKHWADDLKDSFKELKNEIKKL